MVALKDKKKASINWILRCSESSWGDMSTSSHDTGMHCYSSTCTLFSGPSGYFVKVSKRVIRWPFVLVKDVALTDKDVFLFVLFFFPSALKQKVYDTMWARFILHTNSLYPFSSQTSTFNKWLNKWQCTWCFQYAATLIGTVTLCLCVAAVTLSHDWRPARRLVANLRHTHSAQCFLNRIVTALVQAPSKQSSFPNCWLLLEKP